MRITLNIKKSLEKNAEQYFENAKKARRKTRGVKEALQKFRKQKTILERKQRVDEQEQKTKPAPRKKFWYEKFRWFYSSESFLCIGGRDATTNEIIIKKHTDKKDLVFHTEIPGSPFFVVKTQGKTLGEQTIQEAAQATASFSRAWKAGVSSLEVYHVSPEQVTKTTRAGEYLAKGAFMIYGKRTYHTPTLELGVGLLEDGRIMCAPPTAVKAHCKKHVIIKPGSTKTSEAAKKIIKRFGTGTPDEVITVLPTGGVRITQ